MSLHWWIGTARYIGDEISFIFMASTRFYNTFNTHFHDQEATKLKSFIFVLHWNTHTHTRTRTISWLWATTLFPCSILSYIFFTDWNVHSIDFVCIDWRSLSTTPLQCVYDTAEHDIYIRIHLLLYYPLSSLMIDHSFWIEYLPCHLTRRRSILPFPFSLNCIRYNLMKNYNERLNMQP